MLRIIFKAQQNSCVYGSFLWGPSLLLPAFTISIDYEAWGFLSAYRNNFKRWLTAYSICTSQIPQSKQICTVLHNQLCFVKTSGNMNLWTAVRQRNCTGARVLISFISAGAGTCKQVSADSVVELFHALLVIQGNSNARRRIKVILSLSSYHRGAS